MTRRKKKVIPPADVVPTTVEEVMAKAKLAYDQRHDDFSEVEVVDPGPIFEAIAQTIGVEVDEIDEHQLQFIFCAEIGQRLIGMIRASRQARHKTMAGTASYVNLPSYADKPVVHASADIVCRAVGKREDMSTGAADQILARYPWLDDGSMIKW